MRRSGNRGIRWFRYVRHSDRPRFAAEGWTVAADLGPTHGHWSILMEGAAMSTKRSRGQPRHCPTEVTRGQVEALAGFGVRHEEIGLVIGIDDKTLRKWYRRELDAGKAKANAKMAQNIFQKALGDGAQAGTLAIFWAKTQMGWKEPQIHEHMGKDGGPIRVSSEFDNMSADELRAYIERQAAELGIRRVSPG